MGRPAQHWPPRGDCWFGSFYSTWNRYRLGGLLGWFKYWTHFACMADSMNYPFSLSAT